MPTDELDRYRRRGDLTDAPGDGPAPADSPLFVVQEHDASSRHFDLRLEAEGVLKSWAVPKGPSTDPDEQRLAVRTPDHDLDYADFEGHIEEGEYGAGNVIVWDIGPYRNLSTTDDGDEQPVAAAVDAGHVRVWLAGSKLRGGWSLVHARIGGDEDNWLLRKLDDDAADARRKPTSTEPASVLTGRTVEEVRDEGPDEDGAS